MQRKRIFEGHVGMAVKAPRPFTKGWLPGGVLPEETRTTPSATTPYSPSVFYETISCGLIRGFTSSSRHLLAIWLLPIG